MAKKKRTISNRQASMSVSPVASSPGTRKSMQGNKGKDTCLEKYFRSAVWNAGFRGYRVNVSHLPGRPDMCFPGRRIAIFIHGCFWHRCPRCKLGLPKNNALFWQEKFNQNAVRDKKSVSALKKQGWRVLVVWECQIRDNLASAVMRVRRMFEKAPTLDREETYPCHVGSLPYPNRGCRNLPESKPGS